MIKQRSRIARRAALVLVLGIIAFGAGVAMPLHEFAPEPADARALVIEGIGIVDVRAGAIRPGQMIVIADNRIVYAGDSRADELPAGARRISGAGKYAMPALWDMHVHTVGLSPQLHFPLLIANGVTTVRDMGDGCSFKGTLDCKPDAEQWSERRAAATLLAPRLVATASYHVEEAEAGLVAALRARGDRLLKLQLERSADPAHFYALVRQGQAAGMAVAGHLPYTADLLSPHLGPLQSVEHDESLVPQCYPPGVAFDGRNRSKLALLQRADWSRCDAVLAAMVRRGIGYVPTHVASSHQDWVLPRGDYRRDERVRYVPFIQRLMWRAYAAFNVAGTGEEDLAPLEAWYRASLRLTALAHRSGVAVMAGSDSIDAYVTHGFSLHDELAQFVNAGLTPAQALHAATSVPANHLGLGRYFGSIDIGQSADVVILNRNPLDDIANARAIDSVIVDGVLYDRKKLDAMLLFVEQQASSYSVNCKFLWAMLKPW